MIIRSQNKKRLVKINTLSIEEIKKRKGVNAEPKIVGYGIYNYDHYEFKLGEYSTEEKAIKVLDMIEKEYRRATDLDHEWKSSILFCVPRSNVFQMPQDSEV